jgi:hypothetical protein
VLSSRAAKTHRLGRTWQRKQDQRVGENMETECPEGRVRGVLGRGKTSCLVF